MSRIDGSMHVPGVNGFHAFSLGVQNANNTTTHKIFPPTMSTVAE